MREVEPQIKDQVAQLRFEAEPQIKDAPLPEAR